MVKWFVRIGRSYPQHTPFISEWNNPLILAIDPIFQRDILVVLVEPKSLRGVLNTPKVEQFEPEHDRDLRIFVGGHFQVKHVKLQSMDFLGTI